MYAIKIQKSKKYLTVNIKRINIAILSKRKIRFKIQNHLGAPGATDASDQDSLCPQETYC